MYRGFINDQKVESIAVARNTWKTVGAVKAAAHGEALPTSSGQELSLIFQILKNILYY